MKYVYLIFYHVINISNIKEIKKKWWIIYPATYHIPCLVEHTINDGIIYYISSPTKHEIRYNIPSYSIDLGYV